MGFNPPKISIDMSPMPGPLPNIISLPPSPSPSLHIKAPTWRDLLKLLARLSATRIEPTLEAVAVNKSSVFHLRTVIQFIKVSNFNRMPKHRLINAT
jgi:hypothetical protein